MKKPTIWLLEADHFRLRLEFRFTSAAGALLKTKTWELSHKHTDPTKVLLLQLNATALTPTPRVTQFGPN
jgi:hypothetical protein